jgi:hypothetical protein
MREVIHCESCREPITGVGVWDIREAGQQLKRGWHISCAPPAASAMTPPERRQQLEQFRAPAPPGSIRAFADSYRRAFEQAAPRGDRDGIRPETALDQVVRAGLEYLHPTAENSQLKLRAVGELTKLREKAWKYEELER